MNNTLHTPGPWELTDNSILAHNRSTQIIEHPRLKWEILKPSTESGKKLVSEMIIACNANARLISAAPDLLSALQWFADELPGIIRQYCPEGVPIQVANAHDAARSAIAKAKGAA
jgi:hypothetical protein